MPTRPKFHKVAPPAGGKPFRPARETPIEKLAEKAERDSFYCDRRWRRCRAAFLWANPICRHCEMAGRLKAATIAHHVKERLHRPDLAFDTENLMPMCWACHNRLHKSKVDSPPPGGESHSLG